MHVFLSKHRCKIAVAVSLGLHTLVILAFLIGVTPGVSGGGNHGDSFGGGTGSGFTVEMVSGRDVPQPQIVKAPDPADAEALADITTTEVVKTSTETMSFDSPAEAALALNVTPGSDGPAGGEGEGGQSAGVNDPLWKQIEPCWNRLAGKGTSGVMLRIDFSPLGNIAKTDDDPGTLLAPDAPSRAKAVRALGECGPYVTAGSREKVVIAFPASQ